MELCDSVDNAIDAAGSLTDLYPMFELLSLTVIKQLLKSRVNHLRKQMQNIDNPAKDSSYSSVYDEINHLSLSTKPITDKLPTDVMIHIANFVINPEYNEYEKLTRRYLRLLPTLSKAFRAIMANQSFYSKNLIVYIEDSEKQPNGGVMTEIQYDSWTSSYIRIWYNPKPKIVMGDVQYMTLYYLGKIDKLLKLKFLQRVMHPIKFHNCLQV